MTTTLRRRKYRIQNAGSSPFGWIAMLAGGYILLRFLGIDPISWIQSLLGISSTTTVPVTTGTTTNATGQTATTTTNTTNQPTTTPTTTSTPIVLNTRDLVLAKVVAAGNPTNVLLTFDGWNAYYAAVRGIPGPDPGAYLTDANRNMNMSIDEWWGYMTKGGFSGIGSYRGGGSMGVPGIGRVGGVGMILNTSPYTAGYGGPSAGQGLVPLSSETFAKWLN